MPPSGRPGRAAAAAARENLDRQSQAIVIDDSDGETSSKQEGEEGEESDSSSSSADQLQPTAYELERDANIARNKEVLIQLGLASPEPKAPRAKKAGPPKAGCGGSASAAAAPISSASAAAKARSAEQAASSGASATAPAASASASRTASKKRKAPQEGGAAPGAARGSKQASSAEGAEAGGASSAPLMMAEDDTDACFALLCNGDPVTGRLTAAAIRKAARDLGLDAEHQFGEDSAALMIDCFDQGGTGSIELHEFRTIARQCTRRPPQHRAAK